MALTLDGSNNTIAGLAVGGLPDGVVDTDTLAANAVTVAKASGSVKGIQEADQWRISADVSSSDTYLTTNWERNDTDFAKIGTGMSESSGIFSFPSTGIWLIWFSMNAKSVADKRYVGCDMEVTKNNGGAWTMRNLAYSPLVDDGSTGYTSGHVNSIVDITDVSNDKVRFHVNAAASLDFRGLTGANTTYSTFLKLGDT